MDLGACKASINIMTASSTYPLYPTKINIDKQLNESWDNCELEYRLETGVSIPSIGNSIEIYLGRHGDMIGGWTLDETIGYSYDSSGNDLTITWHATPSNPTGKYGLGKSFNPASSEYGDIDNNSLLDPDYITVEAWVKMGTINNGTQQVVIGRANSSNNCGWMLREYNNTFSFRAYVNGAWYTVYDNASTNWKHYVGVYDGTRLKFYVDGEYVRGTTATGVITPVVSSPLTYIMRNPVTTTNYGNGVVDEIRIYNRALNEAEIYEHYLRRADPYGLFLEFNGYVNGIKREREGYEENVIVSSDGLGIKNRWRIVRLAGKYTTKSNIITDLMEPVTDDGLLSLVIEGGGFTSTVQIEDVYDYVDSALSDFCSNNSISFYTDNYGTVHFFQEGINTWNTTFNVSYIRDYAEDGEEIYNRVKLRSIQGIYGAGDDTWTETTTGWSLWVGGISTPASLTSYKTTGTASIRGAGTNELLWIWKDISSSSVDIDDVHGMHIDYLIGTRKSNAAVSYIFPKRPKLSVYWMQSNPGSLLPTNNYWRWIYDDLNQGIAITSRPSLSYGSDYKFNSLDISTLSTTINLTTVGVLNTINYIGFQLWQEDGDYVGLWIDKMYLKQAFEIEYTNTASTALYGYTRDYKPDKLYYDDSTTLSLYNTAKALVDKVAFKEVSMRNLRMDGVPGLELGKYYSFVFPLNTLTYSIKEIHHEINGLRWDVELSLSSSPMYEETSSNTKREVQAFQRLKNLENDLALIKVKTNVISEELDKIYNYSGGVAPSAQSLTWDGVYSDWVSWSEAQLGVSSSLLHTFLTSGYLYVDNTELNLIKNGKFAYDLDSDGIPDEWEITDTYSGATCTLTTQYSTAGSRCLRIIKDNVNDMIQIKSNRFLINPSKNFLYTFQYMGNTGTGTVNISLLEFNSIGSYLGANSYIDKIGYTSAWTVCATFSTTHANARFGNIYISMYGASPGTVYFDDFQCVKQIDYDRWLSDNLFNSDAVTRLYTSGAFTDESKFADLIWSWSKMNSDVPFDMDMSEQLLYKMPFTTADNWVITESGDNSISFNNYSSVIYLWNTGAQPIVTIESKGTITDLSATRHNYFSMVFRCINSNDPEATVFLGFRGYPSDTIHYMYVLHKGTLKTSTKGNTPTASSTTFGLITLNEFHLLSAEYEHTGDNAKKVFYYYDNTPIDTINCTFSVGTTLIPYFRFVGNASYNNTFSIHCYNTGCEFE